MFEHMNSIGNKTVVHLSHNDLDGYGPRIVADLSLVNTVEFSHHGYGDFEEKLDLVISQFELYEVLTGHALVITDIAPSSPELLERMDALHKAGLTIALLDHHDTNEYICIKYPKWAYISSFLNERKTCGTELYYLYLVEKNQIDLDAIHGDILVDLVETIRLYDTWDWTLTDSVKAKELNSLFYLIGPYKFMKNQLDKITDSAHKVEGQALFFNETERLLLDLDAKAEQRYIKGRKERLMIRNWTVDGMTYKVGIVFADQYHSVLGNELSEANPELHFVALINAHGAKVSLRTIHSHIHVGNIAKALHPKGGGHAAAAGFEFYYAQSIDAMESSILPSMQIPEFKPKVMDAKQSKTVQPKKSVFTKLFAR